MGKHFFHRRRLSEKQIIKIFKEFSRGISLRETARRTGHHLDTIRKLASDSLSHSKFIHNFLINKLKFNQNDLIRFWGFIKRRVKEKV